MFYLCLSETCGFRYYLWLRLIIMHGYNHHIMMHWYDLYLKSQLVVFECLISYANISCLRRGFEPICCAFVFQCKLIICTNLGGASLFFGFMMISVLVLMQILVLSSNTKKGEIERTFLNPLLVLCVRQQH